MNARRKIATSAEVLRKLERVARVARETPWPATRGRALARCMMLEIQLEAAIRYESRCAGLARYGRTTVEIGAFASVETPE